MSEILTIVVPSYNISKYVDDILPFYANENLIGKLKVYLIDDGATDDTKFKVQKYIDQYPKIFEFFHKENGGHGSVINFAVGIIKTKYFMIIDGDDWVCTENLIRFVDYLTKVDDDLIVSNCTYEFSNRSTVSFGIRENGDYNFRIHTVTYKTSIFAKNCIKVRENVFYEDSEYVLYPLEFVKKISYFNEVVARYRQDDPNQSVNPEVQLKRKAHYDLVLEDLLLYFERIKKIKTFDTRLFKFIKDTITRIMYGSFELNWSYSRNPKDAINDCRKINIRYKKCSDIYENMKKKYKRFNQMKAFNFNGIRIARLVHRS